MSHILRSNDTMRTRSEAKKADKKTVTPRRGINDAKMKTPKSERKKKDFDTLLGVDDFLSSQHFGSQIEVGWDCNSPDALRNLQRYRGDSNTEVSDIVMQLLNEEPQDQPSQSSDNNLRISPPPLSLWKTSKGSGELGRQQRRLRTRKKSGEESSLQDNLLQTLRDALQKCEKSDESNDDEKELKEQNRISQHLKEETSTEHQVEPINESDQETANEEKKILNYSKDLFESSKVKAPADESVEDNARADDEIVKNYDNAVTDFSEVDNNDAVALDKSDATWSDDELFEEDSFIITATQFPESVKSFNSPVFSMKRKTSDDNVSSKPKSPRYSFRLDSKSDNNADKNTEGKARLKESVKITRYASMESEIMGKPPLGLLKRVASASAANTKPALSMENSLNFQKHQFKNQNNNETNKNFKQKVRIQSSCAVTVPNYSAVKSGLPQYSVATSGGQTNLTSSLQQLERYKDRASSCGTEICSSVAKQSVNGASLNKISSPRNSNFKKHNSFHGQEATKSGAGCLSRQRSFSGNRLDCVDIPASNSKLTSDSIASVTYSISSYQRSSSSSNSATSTSSKSSLNSVPKGCVILSSAISVHAQKTPSVITSANRPGTCTPGSLTEKSSSKGSNSSLNCAKKLLIYPASKATNVSSIGAGKKSFKSNSLSNITVVTSANSSVSGENLFSKPNCGSANKNVAKNSEESMKESPVFAAKKRLSAGVFDTSLSDDLLCQLAEPDDVLDSQICDTTVKPDSKEENCLITSTGANNFRTSYINSLPKTATVIGETKDSLKAATVGTQSSSFPNKGQSVVKTMSNRNNSLSVKREESKTYCFKSSQKPTRNTRHCGTEGAVKQEATKVAAATVKQLLMKPEKATVFAKPTAPVVNNAFSEDLFGDDDDDFLEDGLTEPEILAMLDEAEFLATQQIKNSQELDTKSTHRDSDGQDRASSQAQPFTPVKYSPSCVEKTKEALKRRETNMAVQKLCFNQETGNNKNIPDQDCSPSKSQIFSPDQQLTPTKCPPSDIERKKTEALKRRQNSVAQKIRLSQELAISPSKGQPLGQSHSFVCSQGSPDKLFDDSQDHLLSPAKYSPSEIEAKRQEAIRKRHLSSSQEFKVSQGCSPTKDKPLSQGRPSDEGTACSQGQTSSPVKYSQVEIERKKQEALKRRKLKLTTAQSKQNKA